MIIKNNSTFHLLGRNISYVMAINETGDLVHIHYGEKVPNKDYASNLKEDERGEICCDENGCFLETTAQEYPAYGHTDLRMPAYSIKNSLGNNISRLVYKDYKISEDSVAVIDGMPSVFKGSNSAQTLEVILSYTVFDEYDVILRSSKFINNSQNRLIIESAYSVSVDFDKPNFDFVYFPGAWMREREFTRTDVKLGEKIDISNARGGSGHAINPFVMLCEKNANEKYGEVYGFSLVYSGNHSSVVECDQYGNVRVKQGINPFGFEKELCENEVFYTPQSIICYSKKGFGGLSREIHDLFRNNLCKSKWVNENRPILINNWEATYFDFNEEKLLKIANKAKEIGIELFVLDDGWFGKRNDDTSSLGDWFVNKDKLPSGIEGIAKKINDIGLRFGIWFEPEMVNEDSELFRKHPEWIIEVPNIKPALGRNQYMLDLAKDEVCEYIIDSLSKILGTASVSYVKWDYNRMMSDIPYKGYNHKYILGLYKILDTMLEKFPDILFEGCASGGGRFDAGILAYSPQIWTSDNSDAVSRLKIQYSTSMCYPLSSISAHVTASPNHQVGRVTSLKTRADVAYAGMFGYELDITRLSDDDIDEIKRQIEFYNEIKGLVRTGDLYRLQSPYESNYCTWEIVSKDKNEVFLFSCKILSQANFKDGRLRLEGLDEKKEYFEVGSKNLFSGAELMNLGFEVKYENEDFATCVYCFKIG